MFIDYRHSERSRFQSHANVTSGSRKYFRIYFTQSGAAACQATLENSPAIRRTRRRANAGAGATEDGFTDVYTSLSIGTVTTPGVSLIAYLKTLVAANPAAKLTITGHSLGAALATLLALDVAENTAFASPQTITFASPFVGDTQFVRTYNSMVPNSWRIANSIDVVTKLPPSFWGFDDVSQLVSLSSLGKTKLLMPACAHSLVTYFYLLDQANGGNTYQLDPTCVGSLLNPF